MEYSVVPVPVMGFEDRYMISTNGEVFRVYKKGLKEMAGCIRNGYRSVVMTKGDNIKTEYVHRLVAKAFIPNPDLLPEVNHKDENKKNNKVENLEWCTRIYNSNYGTKCERISEKHKGKKLSLEHKMKISNSTKNAIRSKRKPMCFCVEDGREFSTYEEAAETYGVHSITVKRSCENKTNGRKRSFRWIQKTDLGGQK